MKRKMELVILFVIPILSFYLMECYDRNPWEQIRQQAHFFNILIFELIAWIIFFLVGRVRWAVRAELVFAMVFGLVNHYVMEFRSTPFVPWDIFSVRTAASVADNYDFTPTAQVVGITIVFLLLIVAAQFLDYKIEGKFRLFRFVPAVAAVVVLSIFVNMLQDPDFQTENRLYPFLFTPTVMTKYNGLAVTFAMDLAYLVVEKPSDYRVEDAQEVLGRYEPQTVVEENDDSQELPNVIVIMDEAFSDLAVLGGFSCTEDYMPFVHSLQAGAENTITGMLNVSVCGGNTANSEYEFLTGNTMAFLPSGSIPYQQYVRGSVPTVASQLSDLGYETYAVHPYNAGGWNRDKVYPMFGFDTFYSAKDFVSPSYLRCYIDDASDFQKIREIYEQKEDGKPAFIFNVTMQNHGSYGDLYDNFTPYIYTTSGNASVSVVQYLSLIRETDKELEKLLDYFEAQEEKTIVVFWGDHQPSDAVAGYVMKKNGMDVGNLTEEQTELRYQVPYVIWANYDIEESSENETSANYLAAEVFQAAGLPLSDYQQYLLELKNSVPVISAIRRETNGSKEAEEKIEEYHKVQYYRMFDWEENK